MNKTLLSIICIVVLILVVQDNSYRKSKEHVGFNFDSLYVTENSTVNIDPKEMYKQLMNSSFKDNSCRTILEKDTKLIEHPDAEYSYYPYNKTTYDRAVNLTESGEKKHYEDITFMDGDLLIAPTRATFGNSNIGLNTKYGNDNGTTIELVISDTKTLVFTNVKSWFCHNHEPAIRTHTDIVGNAENSIIKQVGAGQIVGTATSETKIVIQDTAETGTKS